MFVECTILLIVRNVLGQNSTDESLRAAIFLHGRDEREYLFQSDSVPLPVIYFHFHSQV